MGLTLQIFLNTMGAVAVGLCWLLFHWEAQRRTRQKVQVLTLHLDRTQEEVRSLQQTIRRQNMELSETSRNGFDGVA